MTASAVGSGPRISLLLPGWNENHHIFNCIESLQKQTNTNFNVFMILGGEDPKPIEMAKNSKWKPLIVLDQVEPNKMKACNAAFEHPELGEILVFSDMDCEFPTDFIDLYMDAFADQKKNIITGRVCPDPQAKNFVDRYHRHFEKKIAPKSATTIKSIVGSNFAVRKDFFFDKFGRFDESVAIGTDHAIAKRFNRIGERIYFDPRIIVFTPFFSAGFFKYIKQQSRWVRIRVLGNRNSNPKAFRSGLKALLIPWLVVAILPLGMIFSKPLISNQLLPIWYGAFFLWAMLLAKAWLKRFAILRRGKGNLLNDLGGAWGMLAIHYGIQILASLQIFSKRHKYRW